MVADLLQAKNSVPEQNSIVWLENPKDWKYLRVSKLSCGSRRGLKKGVDLSSRLGQFYKLIGYKFEGRFESYGFLYTIYWLKTHDAGCPEGARFYDLGGQPCEAVLVKDLVP